MVNTAPLHQRQRQETILICVRVDTFDEFGRAETDVILASPARLDVALNENLPAESLILMTSYNRGAVKLLFRDYLDAEWSETPFSMELHSEDGLIVRATRTRFGIFALTTDADSLSQAMNQDGENGCHTYDHPIADSGRENPSARDGTTRSGLRSADCRACVVSHNDLVRKDDCHASLGESGSVSFLVMVCPYYSSLLHHSNLSSPLPHLPPLA